MFVEVSVWDFICTSLCIIDARDKPFGLVFPIEIQNRILWMAWHGAHKDNLTLVHRQLETIPVCKLTDWLCVPKPPTIFHSPWKMDCSCSQCDPEPDCHWCRLYGDKHQSVEFAVMETKLQRIRDGFNCYKGDKYRRFVRTYLPIFRDVLQSAVSNIILPMLVWLFPGRYQFNYRRNISDTATFASVSLAHVLFIDGCVSTAGVTRYRHPRVVRQEHERVAKALYVARVKAVAKSKDEE